MKQDVKKQGAVADLLDQHWKTKEFVTTSVLSASGWDGRIKHIQSVTGPMVFAYVFDSLTNFIWMCSVPRDAFVAMSTKVSQQSQDMFAPFRDGLLFVLTGAASGNPPPPVMGEDWESQLGMHLVAYAGTTRTWELADRMRGGGHFIVMSYRNAKDPSNSCLRPFVIPNTNNAPVPADELTGYLMAVQETDKVNHPDWFE